MAKDYNISKTLGKCVECDGELSPGEEFVAVVRDENDELLREDFCLECWDKSGRTPETNSPDVYGIWRTCVPQPTEKKKLFVDDALLINFFERLADAEDEAKVSFRFVLALVLMRKKLLLYEGAAGRDDGREIWKMRFKGASDIHEVIDPKMDADKIAEVSGQLGQILEGEL